MTQFARTVARNSAAGMAAQLTIKVLSFGFSILVVRMLGVETYGQYAGILAFGAVFAFVSDLGLSPYAVRAVAQQRDADDGPARVDGLFGDLLALRLLLSLLGAALLIGTAWLTGRPPVILGAIALGGLGLILYSIQGVGEAMLGGLERLDLAAFAKTLSQVVMVALGLLALALGFGYYGLIGASLISITLMAVVTIRAAIRRGLRPGRVRPSGWPTLLRASLPFGVIAFTLGLSYKFDSLILSVTRGDAETGYYNAAYSLVFAATMLSNVLNTALYPSLARQAQVAPEAIARISERFLRYLLLLAAPIAVGGWLMANQIIGLLFDETYAPAADALRILIWVIPMMFISEFLGYLVVIRGQERVVARAVLISTGVNVAINLALVPVFGMMGAAVMTLVTELVLVGQYIWLLRAHLRQFEWSRLLLRPLIAVGALAALVALLPALPLVAVVLIGGLAYGGLLLVLRVIGQDEVRFIRGLRRAA